MNRKLEIEARLDRSLDHQIAAPKLGAQFDAAVWSRIEAEESRAAQPLVAAAGKTRARSMDLSRWLFVSNVIGGAVAVGLAIYFGAQAFGGVDVGLAGSLDVTMPKVSSPLWTQVMTGVGYVLTVAVLGFTLSLTSFGRRLRAQFG